MKLENIYERICGIAAGCNPGNGHQMKELVSIYSRLGKVSDEFDNMLYEHMGVSCEDVILMLENPDIKF